MIKSNGNNSIYTYVANAFLCYLTNRIEMSSVNNRYGMKEGARGRERESEKESVIAINSAMKTENYLIRNKSYYQTIDCVVCNLFGANHLMELSND